MPIFCRYSFIAVAVATATAVLLNTGPSALADSRVALVIGNSAYRHATTLPNPANDAEAIALLLKRAGFDVVETRKDLSANEMRRAIRDFSDVARDSDIAVVFYAGHGIEIGGNNYLLPVDAVLERDIDVEDETVSLERVLTILESAKRLRLIILDACRDNPFTRTMKRTMVSRAIGRGLARVEPLTSDTLIAFAAKAGSLAADGEGALSPFTAGLIKHLTTPGLDVRIAFGRVRDEVLKNTKKKQEPFVYGSLGGSNVALVRGADEIAAPGPSGPPVATDNEAQAARDYDVAAQIGSLAAWDSFLAKYQTGFYADLGRTQRARLVHSLSVAPKGGAAVVPSPPRIEPKKPTKAAALSREVQKEKKENVKKSKRAQGSNCLRDNARAMGVEGCAANIMSQNKYLNNSFTWATARKWCRACINQ